MSPRARTLLLRLGGAFVVAVAAIGGLEWWSRRAEAVLAAELPARVETAPRTLSSLAPHAAVGELLLCATLVGLPDSVRPVVQVLGDGGIALRRPAPLSIGPERPAAPVAALVLPVRSLAALSPALRAVVLDQIGALLSERPVAIERVHLQGIEGERADLAALLAWLR